MTATILAESATLYPHPAAAPSLVRQHSPTEDRITSAVANMPASSVGPSALHPIGRSRCTEVGPDAGYLLPTEDQVTSAAANVPASLVGAFAPNGAQRPAASATAVAAPLGASSWVDLRRIGSTLDDIRNTLIRTGNRAGAARRAGISVIHDESIVAMLDQVEHDTLLLLRRVYRKVVPTSVRNWQQETVGIGEASLARLLGYIGHPAIATPHHWEGTGADRVLVDDESYIRSVPQLWSYCGYGDSTRRRKEGMSVEEAFACGNTKAKAVLFLMATNCIKDRRSPYRLVYDDARDHYAEHEGWTPAHKHAAAMRLMCKEIVRDLWAAGLRDIQSDVA